MHRLDKMTITRWHLVGSGKEEGFIKAVILGQTQCLKKAILFMVEHLGSQDFISTKPL